MAFNQKGSLSVHIFDKPVVVISDLALQKMEAFTECCDEEIGWLGSVLTEPGYYVIDDVFLFKQEVHGATCELNENDIMQWTEKQLATPEGMELVNRMKVWGHSHVKMANSPSGQDEKQFEELAKNSEDFFIRIITNKLGALRVDFWDKQKGIIYNCLQWETERQRLVDIEAIQAEIKTKVSKKVYTQTQHQRGSYYDFNSKSYQPAPSKKKEEEKVDDEPSIEDIYQDYMQYDSEDDEDNSLFYYYTDAKELMYDFGLTYDDLFEMADMSTVRLLNEFKERYLGTYETMTMLEAEYILKLIKNHIYEQ